MREIEKVDFPVSIEDQPGLIRAEAETSERVAEPAAEDLAVVVEPPAVQMIAVVAGIEALAVAGKQHGEGGAERGLEGAHLRPFDGVHKKDRAVLGSGRKPLAVGAAGDGVKEAGLFETQGASLHPGQGIDDVEGVMVQDGSEVSLRRLDNARLGITRDEQVPIVRKKRQIKHRDRESNMD